MNEFKALAASWARSFMASCLTVYLAGITDPKAILMAGAASVAPVVLRWLNPKDATFGRK